MDQLPPGSASNGDQTTFWSTGDAQAHRTAGQGLLPLEGEGEGKDKTAATC